MGDMGSSVCVERLLVQILGELSSQLLWLSLWRASERSPGDMPVQRRPEKQPEFVYLVALALTTDGMDEMEMVDMKRVASRWQSWRCSVPILTMSSGHSSLSPLMAPPLCLCIQISDLCS